MVESLNGRSEAVAAKLLSLLCVNDMNELNFYYKSVLFLPSKVILCNSKEASRCGLQGTAELRDAPGGNILNDSLCLEEWSCL